MWIAKRLGMCGAKITIEECLFGERPEFSRLPGSLACLFDELDAASAPVPLRKLLTTLAQLDITAEQLRPFVRGDRATYTRRVLSDRAHYQALVLCWLPGQHSPVHDHGGSACAVRVLQGTATETLFLRGGDDLVEPVRSGDLASGESTGSEDDDIHALGNRAEHTLPLISLHLYSPPIRDFNKYAQRIPGPVEVHASDVDRRLTPRIPPSLHSHSIRQL